MYTVISYLHKERENAAMSAITTHPHISSEFNFQTSQHSSHTYPRSSVHSYLIPETSSNSSIYPYLSSSTASLASVDSKHASSSAVFPAVNPLKDFSASDLPALNASLTQIQTPSDMSGRENTSVLGNNNNNNSLSGSYSAYFRSSSAQT